MGGVTTIGSTLAQADCTLRWRSENRIKIALLPVMDYIAMVTALRMPQASLLSALSLPGPYPLHLTSLLASLCCSPVSGLVTLFTFCLISVSITTYVMDAHMPRPFLSLIPGLTMHYSLFVLELFFSHELHAQMLQRCCAKTDDFLNRM